MEINLEYDDVEKIRNLINNRIDEIRYDVNDNMAYGEEDLKCVIREYKALLKKIDNQLNNLSVLNK